MDEWADEWMDEWEWAWWWVTSNESKFFTIASWSGYN